MKVIVTGGGTGGHILPALSVIDSLRDRVGIGLKVRFIGSRKNSDRAMVEASGILYTGIFSGKLRRYFLTSPIDFVRNFRDVFFVMFGIIQAFVIMAFWRPNLIFSKGGYVSLPVIIAGFILRIPIITHESDAALGLSNRIALPFVNKIAVGFETENYPRVPIDKIVYTGNPIRQKIIEAKKYSKLECRKMLKIKIDRPLILMIGGSQGASSLNEAIFTILPKILAKNYLIHLTGSNDYEKALDVQKKVKNKDRYFPFDFVSEELGYMLKAADIVISRAGANTITELAYLEKVVILVPLLNSAGDHQLKNAETLVKSGSAVIFNQKKQRPADLMSAIEVILKDEGLQKKMATNIFKYADTESASRIAEELVILMRK